MRAREELPKGAFLADRVRLYKHTTLYDWRSITDIARAQDGGFSLYRYQELQLADCVSEDGRQAPFHAKE